jgi:hypothetical protein
LTSGTQLSNLANKSAQTILLLGTGASTIAPDWIVRTVVAGIVLVVLHAINLAQTSAAGTLLMLLVLADVPPVGSGAWTKLPFTIAK